MTLEKLGKYEIRATLGRGAMGVVYDGWDPGISRRVAIKTVRLPDPPDSEAQDELARFKREAQAAGRLNHVNVVGVFDYGETAEVAYIVMEFVDGHTLRTMLGDDQRMAAPVVERIMADVLAGLAYCHARGVVHRDIKPANIMITPAGQAKIADFGIARIESSSMTQAGTVMGTPAYMSPEQFMGAVVDARTDIYSTGVLLFQLLTGERPFEGSMTTIMHKVLNSVPPKPSDLAVTVPPSLDAVVARAMARRPEDRFDSAAAFADALRAAFAAPPAEDGTVIVSAPPPPRFVPAPAPPAPRAPSRMRATGSRTPLLAGLAVAVLAAGGAAAYLATRPAGVPVDPGTAIVVPPREASAAPPTRPNLPPIEQTRPAPPPEMALSRPPPSPTGPVAPPLGAAAGPPPPPPPSRLVAPTQSPLVQPSSSPAIQEPPRQGALPPPVADVPPVIPPAPPANTQIAPVGTAPAQTPPIQTPPVQTAPVPPVPVRTAMLSPEMLRPAIGAALTATPCSFTVGSITPQGSASVGGVASGQAFSALRQAVEGAAPGVSLRWQITDMGTAFCPALDLIHSLAPPFGAPRGVSLSLDNARTRLVTDDYIVPHVVMPDAPAYLAVDYLVHDGTVYHLYPNKDDPAASDARRLFAAHAVAVIGEPHGFRGWQVYEPYGRDLVIAIASSVPLLGIRAVDPQSLNEPTGPYLEALKTAIEAARRQDARLAADALVLETAPKP